MIRIATEKCRFIPPRQVTDDTSVLTIKTLVLEPLTRWDDGEVRPGLFSAWSHDGTARRWRFTIRAGATFHDGKPCVAEDITHFIEQICNSVDQYGMKWAYVRYLAAASFSVAARDCVVMEHPTPFADILDILSEFYICRETPAGDPILGTGPYRVVSYTQNAEALLEEVDGGARIGFTAMPLADDRLRALRDGSVDVAMNLERMHAAPDFDARFNWQQARNTMSVMYYLNGFEGLFTQQAARLAVNHAVDVDAMIRDLFHGLAARTSSVVSPMHLGMRASTPAPIPYDPDAAKRLLDGCDVPGRLLIRTPTFMPERSLEMSEAIAASLRGLGLEVAIEVQPDRPEFAREVGRKQIGDLATFDSTPHASYRVLNDKISSATRGLWWQGHDDAELEALILAANQEVAQREAAYGRCMARLRANPPWLYLFNPIDVVALRPGLAGLTLDSKGVLNVA